MVLADGRAVVLAGRENSGDVASEDMESFWFFFFFLKTLVDFVFVLSMFW